MPVLAAPHAGSASPAIFALALGISLACGPAPGLAEDPGKPLPKAPVVPVLPLFT